MTARACVLAAAVTLAGCASSGGTDAYRPISAEELLASGADDLDEAVRDLRPRWLTAGREDVNVRPGRVEVCRGNLLVYRDGRRERRTLREVAVRGVVRVDFVRPGRSRPDGERTCPTLAAVNVITAVGR